MKSKNLAWLFLAMICGLTMFFLISCAGGGGGGNDSADDDSADDDASDDDSSDDDSGPPPGCTTLKQGWNTMQVDGIERGFYIDLPANAAETWPWPVVFSWHGTGDTANNWRQVITDNDWVNNAVMPFIAVTPEHANGSIFGWDVVDATKPNNQEARLFDAVTVEIDKCWGVDWNRIHSFGHSFGGAVSDMLMVLRGDKLASIGTHSGCYASDPNNGLVAVLGNWPDLTTSNMFSQLLVHGSQALDIMVVLNFYTMNLNDRAWLNGKGHDVVICNHGGAHNDWPRSFDTDKYIEFFHDHPLGTYNSPYAAGLPADYPSYCQFSPKEQ